MEKQYFYGFDEECQPIFLDRLFVQLFNTVQLAYAVLHMVNTTPNFNLDIEVIVDANEGLRTKYYIQTK